MVCWRGGRRVYVGTKGGDEDEVGVGKGPGDGETREWGVGVGESVFPLRVHER